MNNLTVVPATDFYFTFNCINFMFEVLAAIDLMLILCVAVLSVQICKEGKQLQVH